MSGNRVRCRTFIKLPLQAPEASLAQALFFKFTSYLATEF